MKQLKKETRAALTACSDPYSRSYAVKLEQLVKQLERLEWDVVVSEYLYEDTRKGLLSGKARAEELNAFFANDEIDVVFDISGGNLANEVIEWLDYETIKAHPKPMFGYSDLTCVLNAVTTMTGMPTYLYQIRNLIYGYADEQMRCVKESLCEGKDTLYSYPVTWIQQNSMEGVTVGGNIRCLLKLAGTPYFPDWSGKILVLESYSGKPALLKSMLVQLRTMGVFKQAAGILLGTFTEMEENGFTPSIEQLIVDVVNDTALPIAKTNGFGHGIDSMCVPIGVLRKF